MAPTGVAAINIGGTVINSSLAIPINIFGESIGSLPHERMTAIRNKLSNVKLIIIDEVSMVSNVKLKHIHERLKQIFQTPDSMLFAGISVIMFGDFYQLPPVKGKPVFSPFKNDLLNLSHPWENFRMIELVDLMLQQQDIAFSELLSRVRVGKPNDNDLNMLCMRAIEKTDENYPHNAIHIYAENAPVDEHNRCRLQLLDRQAVTLIAHDECPDKTCSKEEINEAVKIKRCSDTGGLDYRIKVKEGARVMLTTNLDNEDRLINGQIGTVIKIKFDDMCSKPQVLYIKFDDSKAGQERIRCHDFYAATNNVVSIVRIMAKFKIKENRVSSPEIKRIQFPVTLAWACTIHKVQGLTLDKVVFSLELFRQKLFNYGQVYVALSRVKTLNSLFLLGKLDSKCIRADPNVTEEYNRLRSLGEFPRNFPYTILNVSQTDIVLTLINIRSLKKHCIDIKYDCKIAKSDILALTETRVKPSKYNTVESIESTLSEFQFYRQDNTNEFMSLAVGVNIVQGTFVKQKAVYFPSINGVLVVVGRNDNIFQISLLYRPNHWQKLQFCISLEQTIMSNNVDIILGDFNINYFSPSDSMNLRQLIERAKYIQMVQRPTYISSGSLLDHIYVKQELLHKMKSIQFFIKSIYYSDHDAVQLYVTC